MPEADSTTISRRRLGENLLALGLISEDQLSVALREQEHSHRMLGAILVELDFITAAQLNNVLAETHGLERFDPATTLVDPEVVKLVPKDVSVRNRMLPFSITDTMVLVAMADPDDVVAIDALRRYLPSGLTIRPWICAPGDLATAIDQAHGYEMSIDGILHEMDTGQVDITAALSEDEGYSHPVIRLVNAIVIDAVKQGASDLHFEPGGLFVRLRYRIDGVMREIRTLHKDYWSALSQRIKIMSAMNITDKFNPQDGRFSFNFGSHEIDFRVSVLPTIHGENIVLRVLDKSRALLTLNQLGFSQNSLDILERALMRPEGIIIVTGPTGSGKTTTLYAVLNNINSIEVNIMTLEDPVEYELPLIRQSQVREGTGVNFDEGVRAILRQDPDIVLIGEIRDTETARMTLRAAMTGHQVFATLHTNDALAALPRLVDLGLQPGLLAGNVIAVMAQRLVRKLCPKCKQARPANADECRILRVDSGEPPEIYHPAGCAACQKIGYLGRTVITEIVAIDDELDEIISTGANRAALKACARKEGIKSLAEDGISKVLAGEIDIPSLAKAVNLIARF